MSGDRLSTDKLSGDRLPYDKLSSDNLSVDRLSVDILSTDNLSVCVLGVLGHAHIPMRLAHSWYAWRAYVNGAMRAAHSCPAPGA